VSAPELAAGAAPVRQRPVPRLLGDPLRVLLGTGVGVSVALHGQMAVAGTHGAGWAVVMGVMAALCLSCLVALARVGDLVRTVRMTMGMALAMALAHTLMIPLLGGSGGHSAHAHHGGAGATEAAASGAGHGGMLLVVVVELAVAALAVAWLRRHDRRPARRPV
jgi:hypothetical protein